MTDTLNPYAPPPAICCCRNNNRPAENGNIYTNAGCKLHGIRTNVQFGRTSKEMQIPATSVRQHEGSYHRIAKGE